MNTINGLPKDVIAVIFSKSKIIDRLSMRAVCKMWNEISKGNYKGEPLLPSSEVIKRLLQLASIPVNEVEKEVRALANRASRLNTVQDNMTVLSCVAAATSIGSVVLYHIPEIVTHKNEWDKFMEEGRRNAEEILKWQKAFCEADPEACALIRYGWVECTIL